MVRVRLLVALVWVVLLLAAREAAATPAPAPGPGTGSGHPEPAGVPASAPAGSPPIPARWVRPVDGPVVRRFEAPDRYGPGHRGVTFAAAPGGPVRAVGGGVVAFAGSVAGVRWVSIDHPGGLRTTYGHLDAITVTRGAAVEAGAPIATVGAEGRLHLGLRRGDTYLDPMALFAPPTRARVRLVTPRGLTRG